MSAPHAELDSVAENWRDIHLDHPSMWPTTTIVPLDDEHGDERGYIQSLTNVPVKNVSLIFSKKGSVRANHYHETDWHYAFIVSGAVDYYMRPHGSDEAPKKYEVRANQTIWTPPMEDHAMVFTEDTMMMVMSRNPRDQATYEADVRRLLLVEQPSGDQRIPRPIDG